MCQNRLKIGDIYAHVFEQKLWKELQLVVNTNKHND